MKKSSKDDILTAISICLLLFTALIKWNLYSWLILIAVILILLRWYLKK